MLLFRIKSSVPGNNCFLFCFSLSTEPFDLYQTSLDFEFSLAWRWFRQSMKVEGQNEDIQKKTSIKKRKKLHLAEFGEKSLLKKKIIEIRQTSPKNWKKSKISSNLVEVEKANYFLRKSKPNFFSTKRLKIVVFFSGPFDICQPLFKTVDSVNKKCRLHFTLFSYQTDWQTHPDSKFSQDKIQKGEIKKFKSAHKFSSQITHKSDYDSLSRKLQSPLE